MVVKRRLYALLGLAVLVVAGGALADDPTRPLPDGAQVDRMVVDKSARTLEAYDGDRLLKRYRVALGIGGAGPKVFEGDAHTPEGEYRIDRRHASRAYHRFLHVSYPNAEDRQRHREARARGEVPEGRGIGGDIGVHGEPDGFAGLGVNNVDWTAGCIALDNAEIEELYRAVQPSAVLIIQP